MTRPAHLPLRPLLLACCLGIASASVLAAEEATTTTLSTTTTTSTGTVGSSPTTETKLAQEFANFLGGTEQAQAVVSGLRQGAAFDLVTETTSADAAGTTTTTTVTTIEPPTGTMGYGNVRITLRLAEAELSRLGITQPTPEELSAVLVGGELNGTEVQGILALRAEGMGWGQIAKQYGFTVGQIMGKGAGLTKPSATVQSTSSTVSGAATRAAQTRANGYLPSNATKGAGASQARANGYIPSGGGKSSGAVVTAGGGTVGAASADPGRGHKPAASGAGNLTVAERGAITAGGASAGHGASAHSPGQLKKN